MDYLYFEVLLFSSAYFLIRRRLDIYLVAHLASHAYFMPAWFGRDYFGHSLAPGVYLTFSTVVAATALTALSADLGRRHSQGLRVKDPFGVAPILVSIGIGALIVALVETDAQLFVTDRGARDVWGGVYILWRVASSLLFLYGVLERRRTVALLGATLIALVFAANDRTNVAVIGCALIMLLGLSGRRLGKWLLRPRYVLPMLSIGAAVVWGKLLFVALRDLGRGDVDAAIAVFARADYLGYVTNSEPFVTQGVLNAIIVDRFFVGPSHLVGLIYQLWPRPSDFGYDAGLFNTMFQARLFGVDTGTWGMAYNFWVYVVKPKWANEPVFVERLLAG